MTWNDLKLDELYKLNEIAKIEFPINNGKIVKPNAEMDA